MKLHLRHACIALAVVTVAAVAAAAPALAQDGDRHRDSSVTITGRVEVLKNETVDGTVVSIDGPVRIEGSVTGDVYVVDGNVVVNGQVDGTVVVVHGDVTVLGSVGDDITVIDGRASVLPRGVVRGDLRSSEQPHVSANGRVTGKVDKTDFTGWFTAAGLALLAYLWIAVSVSLLVVGIILFAVFPRAGAAVVRVAHDAVGPSIGWGAIIAFGVPIAAGIAISTLVGLPLGLGALVALGLVFCLGYVVSAAALGRLIVKDKSGLVAFLAGFGILRVGALIPGLGVLVWILASAYGVGVLAVAAYRGGRAPKVTGDSGSSAPPSAPPSPPPADSSDDNTVLPV